jgi:hypothetical protein
MASRGTASIAMDARNLRHGRARHGHPLRNPLAQGGPKARRPGNSVKRDWMPATRAGMTEFVMAVLAMTGRAET